MMVNQMEKSMVTEMGGVLSNPIIRIRVQSGFGLGQ